MLMAAILCYSYTYSMIFKTQFLKSAINYTQRQGQYPHPSKRPGVRLPMNHCYMHNVFRTVQLWAHLQHAVFDFCKNLVTYS